MLALGGQTRAAFPIDDGTKDDSIEKSERLIHDYEGPIRFLVIHHERNRGLSAARNTGTKAASGDYIYYLDSDDEMMPDCIERLLRVAREHPEAEMVIGNTKGLRDNKVLWITLDDGMPSLISSNEEVFSYFYQQRIPSVAWNKLIKRAFIEERNLCFKDGIIHEDILWFFHVMKYLSVVAFVKDITHLYYKRPCSITTEYDGHTDGISYEIIYDEILHHQTAGRESKELTCYLKNFCKFYLKHKTTIPAYKDLHGLYRMQSRQFGCWYAYLVLIVVGVIGYFGNPAGFLRWLNAMRRKVKRIL